MVEVGSGGRRQISDVRLSRYVGKSLMEKIWVIGFEPTTPYTPCKCASQAAPHPDKNLYGC